MNVSRTKRSEDKLISELAKIDTDVARRRFLTRHRSLVRSQVVGLLAPMVVDKVRVDTRQALRLAEAAVLIARRLRRKEDLALALRAKGNALHLSGNNRAAVNHHERALKLYESLGLWKEAARTLSTSIQPLNLLGEYDRAFRASERAREIFTRLGERARIASLDNNVGNIFHRQDRFEEAMAYYERAYKALSDYQQWENAGFTLHNMAMCLINLNDFPRALDCYQTARDLYVRHDMPLLRDQADYNIAYLYYLRGEYSRAIEMLFATRRSCAATGDAYHRALCQLDLSEIYLELNLSEEAREMAHEGYLQFEKLGLRYEAAKALANEAIACGQQGKTELALERFSGARRMFAREKNLIWPRLLDFYQALLVFHESRHLEARLLCTGAAQVFDDSVLTGKAVLCRLLLARIALQLDDLTAAQREINTALTKLSDLQAPALTYQTQLLLGQIAKRRGERAVAYAAYQRAREALEGLRTRLQSEELKISFVKNRMLVYEGIAELYLDAENTEISVNEVFSCIETAKSRSMIEMMFQTGHRLGVRDSGPSELVRKACDLREELNWYYHRIELEQFRREGADRERIARLQLQTRAREVELLRISRELSSHEREIAMLEPPSGFSVTELRAVLPADTELIEYYSAGDRLLAATVTHDGIEVSPVAVVPRVTQLLQLLRFQFSKFRLGAPYTEQFQQLLMRATLSHLEQLYAELIAPLRIPPSIRHLVFVPHGPLHFLPYHALRFREEYLCDRYTISYAPSAALFALCQQKSAPNNQISLVLGIPDRLAPQILREVQSVAALLPHAEVFVGKHATAEVLRSRGMECGLLHIATHGIYRHDNPMFSAIKLGDSYLNLYDLYQLRLGTRLVTLSGCATGMNFVAAGDELLGLQRGLFYAGASSLLLSLWDVHDDSTAELMVEFYKGYVRSADMAGSLQTAMQELRKEQPHPYFWAPFVLVGKVAEARSLT
jgi:CHAT domain-containing protein/tetratricopeptide (TPR) repeat protein